MKRKILTDTELRAVWPMHRDKTLYVPEGTILTPSARDYIRENGIRLQTTPENRGNETMTVTEIPMKNGKPLFQDEGSGHIVTEKPEDMTHLRGNILVMKSHPRVAFRGKIDSLQADVICLQTVTAEECPEMTADLGDVLALLRSIMAAEVKDEPLNFSTLFGMDDRQLHRASHDIKGTLGIDHPTPDYRMGRLCAELNRLRTRVRETELAAVKAFSNASGECTRKDIVKALNRMSSAVYILFCREAAGYYGGKKNDCH